MHGSTFLEKKCVDKRLGEISQSGNEGNVVGGVRDRGKSSDFCLLFNKNIAMQQRIIILKWKK